MLFISLDGNAMEADLQEPFKGKSPEAHKVQTSSSVWQVFQTWFHLSQKLVQDIIFWH